MGLRELWQVIRRMRRRPAFSIGVVFVLALAIGASTAMFALVDAILMRPLPLADPDRLVTFTIVRPGTDRQPLSLPDLNDFQTSNRTLAGITSMFGWSANLTGRGDAERLSGMRVSADYFQITGTPVQLGRPLGASDDQRPSVLISHGMWQRRFGGAADAVGQTLVLNGESFQIIGVLRPDLVALVRDLDVIVPYSPATDVRRGNRSNGFLRVIARLNPDVTLAQAQDDLAGIGRRLRDQYPDSHATDTGIRTVPLHEEVTGRSGPMLRILFVAVILVLLIACANLASLFLVRGTSHRQELALRTALGASRARIAGHVLSEVLILGVIGGALGLFVARTLVEVMISNAPAALPRVAEVGIDVPAALFTLALSLGTSLVAGLVPAVLATRRGL